MSQPQQQQITIIDIQNSAPKHIKSLADYLLNQKKSGLRARNGQLNGQRVIYFKGKSGVNAIKKADEKTVDKSHSSEPNQLLEQLLHYRFILKCSKDEDSGVLTLTQEDLNTGTKFSLDSYYMWLYRGSLLQAKLYGIGILMLILIGVLYPLWPPIMRQGMWYVSMLGIAFLVFMMVLGVIRLIFWLFTKVFVPPGIWIFPNLFADCGFFESFVPFYVWDLKQEETKDKISKPATKSSKKTKSTSKNANE